MHHVPFIDLCCSSCLQFFFFFSFAHCVQRGKSSFPLILTGSVGMKSHYGGRTVHFAKPILSLSDDVAFVSIFNFWKQSLSGIALGCRIRKAYLC